MSKLGVFDMAVRYGKLTAVTGASFTLSEGARVFLTGPNGAGKSSLLGAIAGAVRTAHGRVEIDGEIVSGRGAEDIARGVEEAKAGRVDFRLDRSNLIHVILGKVSFTPEQLADNLRAMVTEIERNRPAGAKGELVRGVSITSTMGPGLNLDLAALKAVATAGA